jgi:hypothetical protein
MFYSVQYNFSIKTHDRFVSNWVHPQVFWWGPCCSSFLFFCVVLFRVFTFWVSCCDFRINTMFGSSLPPVVCMTEDSCFIYVVCVCLRIVVPYVGMLPVSLDCLFLLPLRYSLMFIFNRWRKSYSNKAGANSGVPEG